MVCVACLRGRIKPRDFPKQRQSFKRERLAATIFAQFDIFVIIRLQIYFFTYICYIAGYFKLLRMNFVEKFVIALISSLINTRLVKKVTL